MLGRALINEARYDVQISREATIVNQNLGPVHLSRSVSKPEVTLPPLYARLIFASCNAIGTFCKALFQRPLWKSL